MCARTFEVRTLSRRHRIASDYEHLRTILSIRCMGKRLQKAMPLVYSTGSFVVRPILVDASLYAQLLLGTTQKRTTVFTVSKSNAYQSSKKLRDCTMPKASAGCRKAFCGRH
eukprot:IDg7287t1